MTTHRLRDVALGLLIAMVILVLAGELIVRLFGHTLPYQPDDALGWRPKAHFDAQITVHDAGGQATVVDHRTGVHGFRAFGDPSGTRKRFLFVGDSFTADPATRAEDAYFGIVGQRLPVEVFAIGGGGYGTLQAWMLIEPLLPLVRPDVLVLQYCINDLTDNSYALESRLSHVRNQKNLRPYLVGDATVYRLPPYHPYRVLLNHSRLFRKLDLELMKLQYRFDDPTAVPPELAATVAAERAESVALTTRLMARIVAAMPEGAQALSISCNTTDPDESALWQGMARDAGLQPLPSVSGQVEAAERGGTTVRLIDGFHWNRAGHRLAGEELSRRLEDLSR